MTNERQKAEQGHIPALWPVKYCPSCGQETLRRAASCHPMIFELECAREECDWKTADGMPAGPI